MSTMDPQPTLTFLRFFEESKLSLTAGPSPPRAGCCPPLQGHSDVSPPSSPA